MSPEVALAVAFVVAALATFALTPQAIRLAVSTGFMDRPVGYKGHARPTPYLGGIALAGGVSLATLAAGGANSRYVVVLGCALALWALGTLDDRRNLSPLTRVVAEIGVGLVLWGTGHGWSILGSWPADALLTVLWVVAIVNAFNLMDNMNGAAATCAGVSALGVAALQIDGGDQALVVLCLATAGACIGFLPFNLARPSRIFMGDGGSMLLGTLLAAVTMVPLPAAGHSTAIVAAALVVGLAILDTTLVTVSRLRGGRPVLSGGRDHLTHRLARRLGSAQRVPPVLAGLQALLCAAAVASAAAGPMWLLAIGGLALVGGCGAIEVLEAHPAFALCDRESSGEPASAPGDAEAFAPAFGSAGI